jgi:hypothetical protein
MMNTPKFKLIKFQSTWRVLLTIALEQLTGNRLVSKHMRKVKIHDMRLLIIY